MAEYAETPVFHKSKSTEVEAFFLYVGGKEVESVHRTTQLLDQRSVFPKHAVANMVRAHQYLNETRYKLISLLRYNIAVEPEDVAGVVYEAESAHNPPFLQEERHIDDIHFVDTMNVFQHTNAVFFVFSRDHPARKRRDNKGETKRILFNDNIRKTKRVWKKLKDTSSS